MLLELRHARVSAWLDAHSIMDGTLLFEEFLVSPVGYSHSTPREGDSFRRASSSFFPVPHPLNEFVFGVFVDDVEDGGLHVCYDDAGAFISVASSWTVVVSAR